MSSAQNSFIYIIACSIISLAAAVLFVCYVGYDRTSVIYAFLLFFGLFPPLISCGYIVVGRVASPFTKNLINFILLNVLLVGVAGYISTNIYLTFCAILLALFVNLYLYWLYKRNKQIENRIETLIIYVNDLLVLFVIGFIIYEVSVGNEEIYSSLQRHFVSARFIIGGLVGIAVVFIAWLYENRASQTPSLAWKYRYFIPITLSLFLFDPLLKVDLLHYSAYIGPALSSYYGGWPFVDTYCQYGMCYLLYTFAFKTINLSYTTAALVTNVVNILYYVCYFLLLDKLIKNTFVYVLVGFLALLFYHFGLPYEITVTPSCAGFRFLPVFIVAYALVLKSTKRNNKSCGAVNAFVLVGYALSLLWSLEAGAFSTIIYVAYTVYCLLVKRSGLKQIALQVLFICIFVLIVSAIFAVISRVFGGDWPSLLPNWQMITEHVAGKVDWFVPMTKVDFYSFPMNILLSVMICFAWLRLFERNNNPKLDIVPIKIIPVILLSLVQLPVYYERSIWSMYWVVSLPTLIVMVYVVDKIVLNYKPKL